MLRRVDVYPVASQPGVSSEAGAVIEVEGHIKWFNAKIGYGFVAPRNGLPDVLLEIGCLRRSGYEVVAKGSRVVCKAIRRKQGLQALCVMSIDASTATHPAQQPVYAPISPLSGLERAVCKWFNPSKGYGFLTQGEGAPDIFFHAQTLRACGFDKLAPDENVMVRYGQGDRGLVAVEIHPVPRVST